MPKGNPGRLKSRFEIRGELVPNEYEFQQSHGEISEQEEHENFPPEAGQEGTPNMGMSPQQRQAARITEIEARAHEIVEKRKAKRGGAKKSASKQRGATKEAAGKSSAKKVAKKGAAKSSTKRGAGKKGAKKSAQRR